MNLKEFANKFEMAIHAAEELLADFHVENTRAQEAAQDAFDAYFTDVRSKQKKLDNMAHRLEEQLGELETKEQAFNAELINATIAGDEDNLARIQSSLAEIAAQKIALGKQLQTVVTSQVPRNKELYDKAVSLNEDLEHSNDVLMSNLREIGEVLSNFKKQLYTYEKRLGPPIESRRSKYDDNNRGYDLRPGRCVKDFYTLTEDYKKGIASAK